SSRAATRTCGACVRPPPTLASDTGRALQVWSLTRSLAVPQAYTGARATAGSCKPMRSSEVYYATSCLLSEAPDRLVPDVLLRLVARPAQGTGRPASRAAPVYYLPRRRRARGSL